MAEVLVQFEQVVVGDDGAKYYAQACGAPMPDGLWEGWIEFVPTDGGTPLRSQRETTQPNRGDAVYWATGLTPVYLEGALKRTLTPVRQKAVPAAKPTFEESAPRAILNPYAAYEKGERTLRQELSAISAVHLVNIIRAYGLSDQTDSTLSRFSNEALAEIIVVAVGRAPVR
jgi:hypothetical protein